MKCSIKSENFPKIITSLTKANKKERKAFFAPDKTDTPEKRGYRFFLWWFFYFHYNFSHDLADFHTDWIREICNEQKSVMLVGFRGSIKTAIVKAYLVYVGLYAIEKYIVVQSFDDAKSAEILRDVAKMLSTRAIVADYGAIFPFSMKRDDLTNKSIKNFDTTNGVKFVAKSLGSSLRGANTFSEANGASRPTLLVLDDIDTSDSTFNSSVIEKNYQKVVGETIGAMDKKRARVLFLGNVIVADGVVPRFEEQHKNSASWCIFRQPLLLDLNADNLTPENIAWDFFTPEKVAEMKESE